MYDYTSNNCSHQNSNKRLKVKFGSHTRKTFNRFTTKDSYTWNMTHNMGSTVVRNLKAGQQGSLLVQEQHQEEQVVTRNDDDDDNNNNNNNN